MTRPGDLLVDPVLTVLGVPHAFGTRGAGAPPGCVRPRQVHGATVAGVGTGGRTDPEEADAVVTDLPGIPIAVVTADCVPILLACAGGARVAAVHAGWRGLAAGVIEATVRALRASDPGAIHAAIGPHVGACCYEVDAPVVEPLRARFGDDAVQRTLIPTRPGHHRIELVGLVVEDLTRVGVAVNRIGRSAARCTACDGERFESYRRDREAAGRMTHWVEARRSA